jgi:threonine dehydratase
MNKSGTFFELIEAMGEPGCPVCRLVDKSVRSRIDAYFYEQLNIIERRAEIREARVRIAKTIIRTPLVRLELGAGYPDIRLKLENLQPINAYKLRGAANAVAMLSPAERERGVWTISAGNAGQGVAYAARQAGVPCTVVAIETAPTSKLDRMRALGARLVLVPYEVAWKALDERAYAGVEDRTHAGARSGTRPGLL